MLERSRYTAVFISEENKINSNRKKEIIIITQLKKTQKEKSMLNFLNSSMKSRVKIIKEVPKNIIHKDWKLCFQWCQYIYENGTSEFGYRFIWRDELNRLRPQRGQARIPTFKEMDTLLDEAKIDGWLEKIEKV